MAVAVTTWVWADGAVLTGDEARVAALDRGFLHGEGVYETCRVAGGSPFALTRHLNRLRRSAAVIGLELPWGDGWIRAACADAVGAALVDPALADDVVLRLRITVGGGVGVLGPVRGDATPSLVVAVRPLPDPAPTARVATVAMPRNERSPSAGAKVTSRVDDVLALDEAIRAGADEAVLCNLAGALCEGTGSNLFLGLDGVLVTPSLSTGCLPGVTRELVNELVAVVERDDLSVAELHEADEVFLTSSTRQVQPVAAVDGRPVGAAPGPLTTAAMDAFAALQESTIDP